MNNLKYTFIILSFVFANSSKAQIGVKLGVHSFDVASPTAILLGTGASVNYLDSELGFHGGLFGKIDLGKITLESRLMLHTTEVNYTLNGDNGNILGNIQNERFTNLDIPVLFGFDLLFLDVFLGPVAHLNLTSTSDLIDLNGYESRFSTADYGYRAGLGISLGKTILSLEYEGNFSNFGDHITFAGQRFNFGQTPSRLLLTLGFELF